jgi:hypothetical protein
LGVFFQLDFPHAELETKSSQGLSNAPVEHASNAALLILAGVAQFDGMALFLIHNWVCFEGIL